MRLRAFLTLGFSAFVLLLLVTGCAAAGEETGSVPASAALAPADAIAFVTLVTDDSSEQWEKADRLLGLFPDARTEVLGAVRAGVTEEDLTWEDDVAPALGDELVVVVTADRKPVLLVQPESTEALAALLAESDDPVVQGAVSDWTALAETQDVLDAYRASMGRGTLDGVSAFEDAMTALPADALVRGWADLKSLSRDLTAALGQTGATGELGVDWLAAAVTAEDDGVHLAVSTRTPGGNGSSYEPELLRQVPADAVAALSFGGTQGTLDRVQGAVDVDEISSFLEGTIGVSLDGLVDALSGEGVLYVRGSGQDVPEVTLVLAPPDANGAFDTVDQVARRLAREAGTQVRTRTDGGLTVSVLEAEGVTVTYARLDGGRVIVTTGPRGIAEFLGDGAKLTEADSFVAAAERVGLGERTRGLAYVDVDGLAALGEGLVPPAAQDALATFDSVILEASGEGETTELEGFVRVNR